MALPENLMTTAQVAELADVKLLSVHRWVDRGYLVPVMKLPGRTGAYVFDRASVDAWLAQRAVA